MRPRLRKAIESLSEEQQQEFLNLYSNREQFQNRSSLIKRRVSLKLSRDLSEAEIRQAIASAMGVPLERIPNTNFQEKIAQIGIQSKTIEEIITEYKGYLFEKKAGKDKFEELTDIGRFIQTGNPEFKLKVPLTMLPFPDFEISVNDLSIGIEHTRLIDEEIIAIVRTAKYYIKKAESILKPSFDVFSKTINLYVDYDTVVTGQGDFKNRQFNAEERSKIPQIIANYVKAKLIGNDAEKPSFIAHIEITNNKDNRLDLELSENYLTSNDFLELLLERIADKEVKANNYRRIKTFDKLWLLIVIDDINSFSGFDLQAIKIPQLSHSNFDKIYLFEKFDGNIYDLFMSL